MMHKRKSVDDWIEIIMSKPDPIPESTLPAGLLNRVAHALRVCRHDAELLGAEVALGGKLTDEADIDLMDRISRLR